MFQRNPIARAIAALVNLAVSAGLVQHGNKYSQHTFDASLVLKAAGLVAASAAVATVVDLGSGLVDADIVIDVSALEVASGDEIYDIVLEGSNVAALASDSVQLASLTLGNNAAPADADTATGRYVLPFRNEQNGVTYRYVRLYTRVAGAVATGINYSAFIAKD